MLESYRTTLVLLHILLILLYIWIKSFYKFWQRSGIPFITPSFLVGNFKEMLTLKRCPAEQFQAMYMHSTTAEEPLVGIHIFHRAAVLLRHPELVKRVLVKDFTKFSDRYSTSDLYADSLGSKNLFFIKNPAWKEIRSKISPVFTSGKIKQMFPLVEEIGRQLDSYLLSLPVDVTNRSTCQELKEICALYTTDVIATVAYGVQANSLKNPHGEFRSHGRFIFDFTTKRAIEFVTVFFLPRLVPFFRFKVFPKHSAKFLRSTINYVMRVREETGMARNDLIDLLLEFQRSAKADRRKSQIALEGDILVAQAALFFTAGFETSSSSMSFALYELAKRPDLQMRLRNEIRDALEENGGDINYRMIANLQYLHMIIQEVLRLYPPLGFLDRECTVQDGEVYSFDPFSSLIVRRGMPIYIPVFGIQRDPKYFSNPNEFDPERFSLENKSKIVPFTYLPFGTGPHSCIGERFAMLQAKIGLVNFFRNHYVTTCEKSMPVMKLDPKALITQPLGGIYCNIVREPLIQ
ncbi:probable cytochrome P450 6g2 [Eupeodes corollae]|uniref:probable cytochrome P450 6g2 n=1 Tax=Eupeodes corollae TaxID=290404 RepID=UPI0024925612|nr:probable cytochrome P450 6g2 [Eupeodes corollae]